MELKGSSTMAMAAGWNCRSQDDKSNEGFIAVELKGSSKAGLGK